MIRIHFILEWLSSRWQRMEQVWIPQERRYKLCEH
jgi:hypothetical protein